VVRKYARLAQLEDVTTHTLRHTFATRVLEGSAPDATIARLLGHSSVETTAIYTQPGWEDRVETFERRNAGI
jgi:site-specific recombinase XerD